MMLASPSATDLAPVSPDAKGKRSLASILRTQGALSITDAVDIALDICDELANAHANDVVHGDLGLHRVRLSWPRRSKERVEIFSLGEDDSAAFAFRTSPAASLVAPEQRAGKMVDCRADVWAVGAILHYMLLGRAPSAAAEASLATLPGVVAKTIASCLSVDPTKRPASVDDLAQAIGSFASSPPERFEALARRRADREAAVRARSERRDVSDVLGRLDDLALTRELLAAVDGVTHGSVARSVADRILDPSQRSTSGSVVLPKPRLESRPPPPPRQEPAPIDLATVEKTVPMVPPTAPGAAAGPAPAAGAPAPAPARKHDSLAPVASHRTDSIPSALAALRAPKPRAMFAMAAAFALFFGMAVGMRIFAKPSQDATAAAPPAPPPTEMPKAAEVAPPSAPPPALRPTAASAETSAALPVLTPDALPNAAVLTPRSLPNAPVASPPRPAPVRAATKEDDDEEDEAPPPAKAKPAPAASTYVSEDGI